MKKRMDGQKSARSLRYALLIIASVFILIVANLLFRVIPAVFTKIDTSMTDLYTLSEQTESILENLDTDVTVYHIYAAGEENTIVSQILSRYEQQNPHVHIFWRDPAAYPNFVSQYTNNELPDNSLIIESGEKSEVISYSDIYVLDYEQYYQTNTAVYHYAVESEVSAAIKKLVENKSLIVYNTSGHGEASISVSMKEAIERQGFTFTEVNLLSLKQIPEDCDCLLAFNPQSDFTDEETRLLANYLQSGGRLMLVSDYIAGGRPNLEKLMQDYGVMAGDGVVLEADTSYSMAGYPYYLLPKLVKHGITRPLMSGNYTLVVPIAQGLQLTDKMPENIIAENLMVSSESAYLKNPYEMTDYAYEEGEPQGEFALAVASANTKTNASVVWMASVLLWEDEAIRQSSGANQDFILNSFGWLCDEEEVISIHAKTLQENYLTVSNQEAVQFQILFIAVIPFMFLAVGIAVTIMRRRRV